MHRRWLKNVQPWTLAAVCAALLTPAIASATLGEAESSAAADAVRFSGSVKSEQHSAYRLHEMVLPSGTVVREFAANGLVFAIAWHGATIPDLRQALGKYFDRYIVAQTARSSGHTHVQLRDDGLNVQVVGHMRAYFGRVYLPAAVPGGVDPGSLR